MRRTWMTRGAGFALLGVVCAVAAVGCRHTSRTAATDSAPEPAVTLGDSQVADVQVALGRTMESRGQSRQAIPLYAEAVRKDPRRADGWVRLAVNSDKEGMFSESAEYYQKALALEPDNADTYCNLGYSLYLQQRLPEAEAALQRAVELRPDHKRARNNLGLVLARAGRGADAMTAFRQAGCTQADAHANLAYALTLQGQLPEARAQYEQALALDANSASARKGLGELAALAPMAAEPVRTTEPAAPRVAEQGAPRGAAPPPPAVVPASYIETAPVERTPPPSAKFEPVSEPAPPPGIRYEPASLEHSPPPALAPYPNPEATPSVPAVAFYRIPSLRPAPRTVILTCRATRVRITSPISELKETVVSGQTESLDATRRTETSS